MKFCVPPISKVSVLVMAMLLTSCTSVSRKSPIIDMQGVDIAAYQQDLAECESYADQVNRTEPAVTGAATGAAVGGVLGAAVGNSRTAQRGAGAGAVSGGLRGARQALAEQDRVLRNCLRGRGYRVLN
jgi:outer membrane lipoprotein SlyB